MISDNYEEEEDKIDKKDEENKEKVYTVADLSPIDEYYDDDLDENNEVVKLEELAAYLANKTAF